MAEENQNLEETIPQTCTKNKCCCGKLFCLKGLATIYKMLSILTLLLMVVVLFLSWREASQAGYGIAGRLIVMAQYAVSYLLGALFFITVSRVLKTLRKIKHAVEHR